MQQNVNIIFDKNGIRFKVKFLIKINIVLYNHSIYWTKCRLEMQKIQRTKIKVPHKKFLLSLKTNDFINVFILII